MGDRERMVRLYRLMLTIRLFEERVIQLFRSGLVGGNLHLYTGQEAVAVGVCEVLGPGDLVTSTHRSLGHAIAKGCNLKMLMAELLGRTTGYCRGRGGKMHLSCPEVGFLTANGIVGAGVGIAGGAALWHKLTGSGRVVVSFFGDGAANHGYFLESLNLASLWALPLLLVCENNGYAISTPTRAALAGQGVLARTSAFGIPGESVDGTNVLEVMQAAERAVKRIREGAGPWLIECRTLRLRGHYEGDPQHYRPEEEIATVAASDSLSRFELELRSEWGWTDEDEHRLRSEILAAIEEAQAFAEASPFPLTDEMEEFLYPGGDQGEKN